MISHIRGTILHLDLKFVIIETETGLGYKVSVTPETLETLTHHNGKPVSLWTHFVVREDAQDLYGFLSRDALSLFEALMSVSGIGPKTALGIISGGKHEHIIDAIASRDATILSKTAGVGKKNAEKIVMELGEKFESRGSGYSKESGDALEALEALGWSDRDAREALKKTKADAPAGERVKEAMKYLSHKK